MEKMNDLRDLLKHEIQDLYSAEEQIIEAMPLMIENANDAALKSALREHLAITKKQKARLDQVQKLMNNSKESNDGKSGGLFSRLFGGGGHKCKGTQGIIEEGNKIMGEDMNPEVMDAAIIASAQKIEHYEICGYGTAKAYARELKLDKVEALLDETLQEEYEADERLTSMAVGRLNTEAKQANRTEPSSSNTRSRQNGGTPSSKQAASSGRSTGGGRSTAKGSAAKKAAPKKATAKSSSKGGARGNKTASKKGASKKAGASRGR